MRTSARLRTAWAGAGLIAVLAVLPACAGSPTINSAEAGNPTGAAAASGSATPGVPGGPGSTAAQPSTPAAQPQPDPAPPGLTGVDGFTLTVRCPVMPDAGCPPTPVSARVTVTDAADATVATVTSDTHGHFRLALRPGVYTLFARSISGALPRPASVKLTVVAGRMMSVELTMDSGIR